MLRQFLPSQNFSLLPSQEKVPSTFPAQDVKTLPFMATQLLPLQYFKKPAKYFIVPDVVLEQLEPGDSAVFTHFVPSQNFTFLEAGNHLRAPAGPLGEIHVLLANEAIAKIHKIKTVFIMSIINFVLRPKEPHLESPGS
ncbi:MAG: hypothetical protein ACXVB9_07860 [Bdellovibrionota bacterium]